MGGNSSRDVSSKVSSNPGFTPLTPLKRPGSIRRLKSEEPTDAISSSRKISEAVVESVLTEQNEEQTSISLEDLRDQSPHHECLNSGSGHQTQRNPNDVGYSAQDQCVILDSGQFVSETRGEIVTEAAAPPSSQLSKAVYGAAYPPEMAEVIMKQFNGNSAATFGSSVLGFGNLKIASPTVYDGSTNNCGTSSKDQVGLIAFQEALFVEDNSEHRAKAKFEKVLDEETVNLTELQRLCWSGCPADQRADTWRLLLRYMPANSDRREAKMSRLRAEYADAVVKYFDSYDPASASPYDRTMYNQIAVDLPRTNPSVQLFQNVRVQGCLHRILYVWAIRHPGTGYVQGINDLVTPFFFVFLREQTGAGDEDVSSGSVVGEEGSVTQGRNFVSAAQLDLIEADCYHCLTNLLDNAQDNYVLDSRGIQEKVFMLKRIIARLDDKLVAHFERMEVEFLQFAFRWFNCLLMREFSLSARSPSLPISPSPLARPHLYPQVLSTDSLSRYHVHAPCPCCPYPNRHPRMHAYRRPAVPARCACWPCACLYAHEHLWSAAAMSAGMPHARQRMVLSMFAACGMPRCLCSRHHQPSGCTDALHQACP
jgi:hypothetical protein